MIMLIRSSALLLLLSNVAPAAAAFEFSKACKPCADTPLTEECEVVLNVNFFPSQTGYFEVAGCEGVNPTLHLSLNRVYKFNQEHLSNWYHLIGFAYEADGAHVPVDELEPGITRLAGSDCSTTNTCPAPMYFRDGEYQGVYSNIASLKAVTTGEDDFGLDNVEPLFFHPIQDWQGYGVFDTYLMFDQEIDVDIFYFCHVHAGMTGRIKLLDAEGNMLNPDSDSPEIPYEYDEVSEYDATCGTTGIGDFQLPNNECMEDYVCLADGVELTPFMGCLESMNCAMMAGMTTNYAGREALFCHQMIPHHENAVNMAKSLLKVGNLNLADCATDASSVDCQLEPLLYDMINVQNSQIIDMRDVLDQLTVEEFADCVVDVLQQTRHKNRRVLTAAEQELIDQRALQEQEEPAYEHSIPCTPECPEDASETCSIGVRVDPFAGAYGYFQFVGCEGVNPTLHLTVGRTYEFLQGDVSNWFHLISFAYDADGAHVGGQELGSNVVPPGTTSTCVSDSSCPAAEYYLAGEVTDASEVEAYFFHPLADWQEYGVFWARLNFDEETFAQDLFYFDGGVRGMSGRIKLVKADGTKVSETDTPEIPYEYDSIEGHDKVCGTHGLNSFELPNAQCPPQFVCLESDFVEPTGEAEFSPAITVSQYTSCIDSMDCAMFDGMSSNAGGEDLTGGASDDIVLFLRQMIAHHENAVNMAKVVLKSEILSCSSFAIDEGTTGAVGCVLEPIIRGIIVTQSVQIDAMKGMLEQYGAPLVSDCDIPVPSPVSTPVAEGSGVSAAEFFSALGVALAGALI